MKRLSSKRRQTRKCLPAVGALFALVAALFGTALADTIPPSSIQLNDFLTMLREQHPLFAETQLNVETETLEREMLLGGKDWLLSASAEYAQQREVTPALFPDKIDRTTTGVVLERAFWRSGGRLQAGWDLGHTRSLFALAEPFSLPAASQYENQFSVVYSHPLIKNARGVLDRTAYEASEYSVTATALQVEEDHESFLVSMAQRFVAWASHAEQYQIAVNRIALAREQLAQAQRKHRSYLIDKIDVLRAQDAVRAAESRGRLVLSQRDAARAELAVLAQFDGLVESAPKFDFRKRFLLPKAHAIANSRPLRILALRRDQLQREQQGLLEAKKPNLSLQLAVTRKGGGRHLGDIPDLNTQDFSVGLVFRVPLGNRTASARARQGETRLRQLELLRERIDLALHASFQNLVVQLAELERVLVIDASQIESARAKTEEEVKHYNDGRGDLTFVIQAQDAEGNAGLIQLQNATTYHQLNLELDALLDQFWPIRRDATGSELGGIS